MSRRKNKTTQRVAVPIERLNAIVTDLLYDSIEDDVLRLRAEQVWGLSAEAATAMAGWACISSPRAATS